MPVQDLPEGVTIDRAYWQDDQRGVNVNYEKDGITIAGQFVVKYYNREADQFIIAVNANRPTGNYIEVGCNIFNALEAADWLVYSSDTLLGGLFQEDGDISVPMHAILAMCAAMANEAERLCEFAKTSDQHGALQRAIQAELERPMPDLHPGEDPTALFERLKAKHGAP